MPQVNSAKMKRRWLLVVVFLTLCIVKCQAKYSISASDSVSLNNCDLSNVRNISQLNASPEEIIVNNCRIDELPNALFIRFYKLRVLEITDSRMQSISDFAFNGLSLLQVLNLSRNNLTVVKIFSDAKHEALNSLDLRRNEISSLHKNALRFYPNLLKLNLAVNQISEIPDEFFRFTPFLKSLNLGRNDLKSISLQTFKFLHKLIHLELKQNQIEFIDAESFVGCTHLRSLHMQENRISLLNQELFSNLPRLHHLNLSHNFLEHFENETFEKNEELELLDISYNEFESFNEFAFKGLEVLEVLNASHNEIKHIDSAIFKHFTFLKYLDLSSNRITSVTDGTFDKMVVLVSIKLNNNTLTSIGDSVFSGMRLKLLDLSSNQLSTDNFLWPAEEIEHLNLTDNAYKALNASLLDSIMLTDLWENPFDCEWLVREIVGSKNVRLGRNYVVASRQNILKAEGIQCFDNEIFERRLIVVESKEDLVEEVDVFVSNLRDSRAVIETGDFDFRSALLWFSSACLGVFAAIHLLKCLLNKSERQSEEYRISRLQPAYSTDDVLKNLP